VPGPISTIARLARGWFYGHQDEVSIVPDRDFIDCTKYRGGSWWPSGWLVALSGNVFGGSESNPTQWEKGKWGIRHNDDYPKDTEAYEIVGFLQLPGGRDDITDIVVMRITTDYVEAFGRKVFYNDRQGPDAFVQGVTALYQALLGRSPESAEVIESWRASTGGNLDLVRQGILGSPEYRDTH